MFSDTKHELMSELKKIWNNRDFVCGAMSNAGSENAWKKMLDYIKTAEKSGIIISSDEILLLSLDLGEEFEDKPSDIRKRRTAAAML